LDLVVAVGVWMMFGPTSSALRFTQTNEHG
jgi:hypothetical protein